MEMFLSFVVPDGGWGGHLLCVARHG